MIWQLLRGENANGGELALKYCSVFTISSSYVTVSKTVVCENGQYMCDFHWQTCLWYNRCLCVTTTSCLICSSYFLFVIKIICVYNMAVEKLAVAVGMLIDEEAELHRCNCSCFRSTVFMYPHLYHLL